MADIRYGNQDVTIIDESGNVAGVTSSRLDVNARLIDLQSSRGARITLLEELAVGGKQTRLADSFADGIDTTEWTTSATGSATATATAGVARIATGVTTDSTISFTTSLIPRFFPGTVSTFQSGVTVSDVGTANNTRRWGAFDANNGYFFELSGTTLRAVSRSNISGSPVDTATTISSFTLDANNHTYEIEWQGNAALFLIDRVNVTSLTGNTSSARTNTLDFPVRYENNNSGGLTTNLNLDVRGTNIASISGQDLSTGRWGYNAGTSGSLTLTGGKRVLQITAIAQGAAATMTINAGDTITLPYDSTDKVSSALTFEPKGNLVDPALVFTGTDAYMVEWVS